MGYDRNSVRTNDGLMVDKKVLLDFLILYKFGETIRAIAEDNLLVFEQLKKKEG